MAAPANYRDMWRELGLNLESHDALLAALGTGYSQVMVSQKDRPKAMDYFNFVMSEIHCLRIRELVDARAAGKIVVGAYCTFVPEELVLAVGGVCVGLCSGADWAMDEVEKYLPRNTCALIKSALGFKLGGVCPYVEACQLIVGENTCDGKKKAYEIFAKIFKKPFHVMDLPNVKNDQGKSLFRSEYARLLAKLEEVSGRQATPDAIAEGVRVVNEKRAAVQRLARLRGADPSPISGLDALLVSQVYFYDDPVRFTKSVNALCDEIDSRIAAALGVFPKGRPRILVSGCPMSAPNWKVHSLIEGSGAVVVGEESCVGERGTRGQVAVDQSPLDALVERYMQIDCAIFSPNASRLEHIKEMAKRLGAHGVVLYGLHFCSPYLMEAMDIEKELERTGIPAIRLETDYSSLDTAQLKTRIEAFVERIAS
jgi:benzoyl-CoA reductase/2-hydroxyglutaryl-CoA dehydratase subunit BcrC/BadD/HgdB